MSKKAKFWTRICLWRKKSKKPEQNVSLRSLVNIRRQKQKNIHKIISFVVSLCIEKRSLLFIYWHISISSLSTYFSTFHGRTRWRN